MRQFGFIGGLLLLAASSIGAKKSGKGNFGKGLQNLSFYTRKSKQYEGVLAVSFPMCRLTKTIKAFLYPKKNISKSNSLISLGRLA